MIPVSTSITSSLESNIKNHSINSLVAVIIKWNVYVSWLSFYQEGLAFCVDVVLSWPFPISLRNQTGWNAEIWAGYLFPKFICSTVFVIRLRHYGQIHLIKGTKGSEKNLHCKVSSWPLRSVFVLPIILKSMTHTCWNRRRGWNEWQLPLRPRNPLLSANVMLN